MFCQDPLHVEMRRKAYLTQTKHSTTPPAGVCAACSRFCVATHTPGLGRGTARGPDVVVVLGEPVHQLQPQSQRRRSQQPTTYPLSPPRSASRATCSLPCQREHRVCRPKCRQLQDARATHSPKASAEASGGGRAEQLRRDRTQAGRGRAMKQQSRKFKFNFQLLSHSGFHKSCILSHSSQTPGIVHATTCTQSL